MGGEERKMATKKMVTILAIFALAITLTSFAVATAYAAGSCAGYGSSSEGAGPGLENRWGQTA